MTPPPAMPDPADVRVPVLEIFSSFQGEGPRVGERQVFLRLAKCDLRCAFCDTPESYPTPDTARVQVAAPHGGDERPENPMRVGDILAACARLDDPPGLHAAISITGGEPLLHPQAVHAIADGARGLGLRVHVETGGHRPGALEHVLDVVDEVSPDFKLESVTGQKTPWDAHAETYALLEATGKGLAIKAVVGADTPVGDVVEAARFCAEHGPSIPLILQPATPFGEGPGRPTLGHLYELHDAAGRVHPDVRVIPQVHTFMGLR